MKPIKPKKKVEEAKTVVWDTKKKKAPKGEIVRIFPRYDKLTKKKKNSVLLNLLDWISAELKRTCK